MEKALRDTFYTLKGGQTSEWSAADIDMVLDAANDAPVLGETERQGMKLRTRNGVPVSQLSELDIIRAYMHKWLCCLLEDGVTEDLLDELNFLLLPVRYVHILTPSTTGIPYWQRDMADANMPFDAAMIAAHTFSNQLAIGALMNLKYCNLPECSKFFIGRPNAKWCSPTCGSKHRVRKKRKREKE